MSFLNIDLTKANRPSLKQKSAVVRMLSYLVSVDDGARRRDHRGFNKEDTEEGHELYYLVRRDASVLDDDYYYSSARKLLYKYWRQLPSDCFDAIYGAGAWNRLDEES